MAEKDTKSKPQDAAGKSRPDKAKTKGREAGQRPKKTAETGAKAETPKRTAPPRLFRHYQTDVIPALRQEFAYKNVMQVPRVVKITLNMGLGEALQNQKILDASVNDLRAITGQSPVVTRAKKSIATFKLRQGQKIGCMVTLRRERMWEFLDRLVNLALPRVRDFKGVSPKSFDGRGNYSLGLREQIIFPEIDYDQVERLKGMNISIITSALSDDEGRSLLRLLGMPFRS